MAEPLHRIQISISAPSCGFSIVMLGSTPRRWAAWCNCPRLLVGRHVKIQALDSDPARSCKTIRDEVHGTEQSRCEFLDIRLHPDRGIFEEPSARFDIDLFARCQEFFKDIAVPVQPKNAGPVSS